jgi:hypothetical protein
VWLLALGSFLPAARQDRAIEGWLPRLPLLVVLALQAILSLRLTNSPFQDESEYLYIGHLMHGHHAVPSNPSAYLSGAPQLYPYAIAYLDAFGGLGLARAFSTLCMVSATIAIFWTAKTLFDGSRRVGLFAALAFALSPPVIFLGHFATFDAPSFTCLAWAAAITVWASRKNKGAIWAVLVGGLLFLAVALKYASAIDVPFVLLLSFAGWREPSYRVAILGRGVLSGLVAVGLAVASALTWGRADLAGLRFSTLQRQVGAGTSELDLWQDVLGWTGATLILMAAGGVLLLRRRPVLAVTLLLGLLTATAYQIHTGEATSLQKHVTLGLLLGAPLAGYFLSSLWSKRLAPILVLGLTWLLLVLGLAQSNTLFAQWPDTTGLAQAVNYSITSYPQIRIVADVPQPLELAFRNRISQSQWHGTDGAGFEYKNQTGVPAIEQALTDNYFQLAILDGSTPSGAELMPKMASFGFTMTSTVDTIGNHHTWQIWQRYNFLGK